MLTLVHIKVRIRQSTFAWMFGKPSFCQTFSTHSGEHIYYSSYSWSKNTPTNTHLKITVQLVAQTNTGLYL